MDACSQDRLNDWLFDLHTHLGFAPDPSAMAADYGAHRVAGLVATVRPEEYRRLVPVLKDNDNVCLALGAHPWWIHDGRIQDEELEGMICEIPHVEYIAEIGLDFSKKFVDEKGQERQLFWFHRMCEAISLAIEEKQRPYVISIHSVKATTAMLNILEAYDLPHRAICIFHWFSGTHEELVRAVKLGCYFSINITMLHSKRSEPYMKTIPADRIFLETDMPGECHFWDGEMERDRLEETRTILKEFKQTNPYMISAEEQAKILNLKLS